MHPWGIKVSIMEPGGFQTQITEPRAIKRRMRQGWDDLSEELKKEYGKDYLEKGIKLFTFYPLSSRTYQVVDAVVDALTSQSPRDRYLVGFDARFFFAWMFWLPAVVVDFIMTSLIQWNPAIRPPRLIRPPRCYDHFVVARTKTHSFLI
ncbi:retinol dehydrogenase [Desmophyllum pertusum]|uniref:Retinol dehydrogenase n=1 Tax=Desmophyllum pertusum TaxID=174260 RepID=A0A9W9YY77_9CNID|nr:retinol dehydrogenase [Desmophyllum pertusum]